MKDSVLRPVDNIDKVLAVDFEFINERKCGIYYKVPRPGPAHPVTPKLADHDYMNHLDKPHVKSTNIIGGESSNGKIGGAIPKAKARTSIVPPPLPKRNPDQKYGFIKRRAKAVTEESNTKNEQKEEKTRAKSIDLDHIYQNIWRVGKNFPWKKKKTKRNKLSNCVTAAEEFGDNEVLNIPPPSYEVAQKRAFDSKDLNIKPDEKKAELDPQVISSLFDLNLSSSGSSNTHNDDDADYHFSDEEITANLSYVKNLQIYKSIPANSKIYKKLPKTSSAINHNNNILPNYTEIMCNSESNKSLNTLVSQTNVTYFMNKDTHSYKIQNGTPLNTIHEYQNTIPTIDAPLNPYVPNDLNINRDKYPIQTTMGNGTNTPTSNQEPAAVDDLTDVLSYPINEWKKKKQWQKRMRKMKNIQLTEEDEPVDVALIFASDGKNWVEYFRKVFLRYSSPSEKVRLLEKNIEEFDKVKVPPVLEDQIQQAKLQLVVLSPKFLRHIERHPDLEIGHLFISERVLSILLGITNANVSSEHRAVLYTFNEWHHHRASHSSLCFVNKVLKESWNILSQFPLEGYKDINPLFKITPRKVTQSHRRIHIMLNKAIEESEKKEVKLVVLDQRNKTRQELQLFKFINPYTIIFDMPELYMKSSCCVSIELWAQDENYGAREIKCETTLDQLNKLLANSSNPMEVMCQALNVSRLTNDLDNFLTSSLDKNIPSYNLSEEHIRNNELFNYNSNSKLPTWLHFSAHYGLHNLTWKLLDLPGCQRSLNVLNSEGKTPSLLALEAGFRKLAQELENMEVMSTNHNNSSIHCEEEANFGKCKHRTNTCLSSDHQDWHCRGAPPFGMPLTSSPLERYPGQEREYLTMSHLEEDSNSNLMAETPLRNTSGNEYLPEPTKLKSNMELL